MQRGNTALHIASIHGQAEMCRLLIDRGARINATCKVRLLIDRGARINAMCKVRLLIDRGARINATCKVSVSTVLHIVRRMLQNGKFPKYYFSYKVSFHFKDIVKYVFFKRFSSEFKNHI